MTIQNIIDNLTLREKIAQMFIFGYYGDDTSDLEKQISNNLGGIILFAENITDRKKTTKLIKELQSKAKIPLFVSIDQEGGLVERTIRLNDKIDYLTPAAISQIDEVDIQLHTKIMSDELNSLGFNMNFAPVLDVNTNPHNPIIGIRAFSDISTNIIKPANTVVKTLIQNNIIPVGKHFPGHGEASVDSHKDLPTINLDIDTLEQEHIYPFKVAIENGLDSIMVAHVAYPEFGDNSTPASLSKKIIDGYLRKKLNFDGLAISDDMVMGGVANHYNTIDACTMAINAGIDLFIFRNCPENIIDEIVDKVKTKIIDENTINTAIRRILKTKEKYGLFTKKELPQIDVETSREQIFNLAKKTIRSTELIELIGNILVLSPDKKQIFNYSFEREQISDYMENTEEITYSLNPDEVEIKKLKELSSQYENTILITYNAVQNTGQLELFKTINPSITIICGISEDFEILKPKHAVITNCYKSISLKAVAETIFRPLIQ